MRVILPSRRGAAGTLGLVLLLSAALYAPSLRNGFAYDAPYIAASVHPSGRANPLVAELQSPAEYFRSHYWKGEHAGRPEYRPVTIASYALIYRVLGRAASVEALPQHAANLLLHLFATALSYRLMRAARAPRAASLVGALVFGLHAVHSEVVASVVGRAELLGFVFGASASLLALGRAHAGRWLAAALLFFLAIASKENALAWAPFIAAMWIARARARDPHCALAPAFRSGAWRGIAVCAVPIVVFLVLRARVLAELPVAAAIASLDANPLAHVPTVDRLLSAVVIQGFALGKTLLPVGLVSDYGRAVFRLVADPMDLRFLFVGTVLSGLGVGALASLRGRPLLFLAGAAFFGFSFLTSNLPFAIGTSFGERLLYTPSLGVSYAAAWLAVAALRAGRGAGLAFATALAAWLLVSAAVVLERNAAWYSDATLSTTDAIAQPRSVKLNILAADVYRAQGDRERQFEHLARAFAPDARPARSWLELSLFFLEQRNWEEAEIAALRGLGAATGPDAAYRFQLIWVRGVTARASGRAEDAQALQRDNGFVYRRLRRSPEWINTLLDSPLRRGAGALAWRDTAAAFEASGKTLEAERTLRLGLAACRALPAARRFPLHWQMAALFARSGRRIEMAEQLDEARLSDPLLYAQRTRELAPDDPRRAL